MKQLNDIDFIYWFCVTLICVYSCILIGIILYGLYNLFVWFFLEDFSNSVIIRKEYSPSKRKETYLFVGKTYLPFTETYSESYLLIVKNAKDKEKAVEVKKSIWERMQLGDKW